VISLRLHWAESSIEVVSHSIEWALDNVAKRHEGHIRASVKINDEWVVAATQDFGNRSKWEYEYEVVATSKMDITQRTGLSTREVQALYPTMLKTGDTIYFGSVISAAKDVVWSYSGVEAYYDEMFSKWGLAAYEAFAEHWATLRRNNSKGIYEL
jgi:hypothetical protein